MVRQDAAVPAEEADSLCFSVLSLQVAYLVNRAGAKRLMEAAKMGFRLPIDGHIWYHNQVYAMPEDWISHPSCPSPCKDSVRTWLNGELGDVPAPD